MWYRPNQKPCPLSGVQFTFYNSSFIFIYGDEIYDAEDFGNILFGFSGNAGGYLLDELQFGGSFYSYLEKREFDSPQDAENIGKGYDLYDIFSDDYSYVHIIE